jgi:hypothetical protein
MDCFDITHVFEVSVVVDARHFRFLNFVKMAACLILNSRVEMYWHLDTLVCFIELSNLTSRISTSVGSRIPTSVVGSRDVYVRVNTIQM